MTAQECHAQAANCRAIAAVERERGREEERLAWERYARDWDELAHTAEKAEREAGPVSEAPSGVRLYGNGEVRRRVA